MKQYKIATVATNLIDGSKESKPFVFKHYILEEEKPWKKEDITSIKRMLERSPLIKEGSFGTAISYSDLDTGNTRFAYYNRNSRSYAQFSPYVRNLNLETPRFQGMDFKVRLPELEITRFDQRILCKEGLEEFKEEWCPSNFFKINQPEGL